MTKKAATNYSHVDRAALDDEGAQVLISRLGGACAWVSADIDRVAYVEALAIDVIAAKARPRCPQPHKEPESAEAEDG